MIEVKHDSSGNRRTSFKFPDGCEKCSSATEWDCNNCLWVENSWKYDEVGKYYVIAQWAEAGMDLNRINELRPDDFIKISIIRKFL